MSEKILIIDCIEDIFDNKGELAGKHCFDSAENNVKVKAGQGGGLKKRWDELVVGRAYSFTMGAYKPPGKDESYPYVQDFKSVESQFVEQAQKKVESKQVDNKNRAMVLSYAKDLVVADKIPVDKIFSYAEAMDRFVTGNITVEDEEVFKSLLHKVFKVT